MNNGGSRAAIIRKKVKVEDYLSPPKKLLQVRIFLSLGCPYNGNKNSTGQNSIARLSLCYLWSSYSSSSMMPL